MNCPLENLTFKILTINKFVHLINIVGTLYFDRYKRSFVFMIDKTWKASTTRDVFKTSILGLSFSILQLRFLILDWKI